MTRAFAILLPLAMTLAGAARAQVECRSWYGLTYDEGLGGSVRGMGDLDGDGVPDVALKTTKLSTVRIRFFSGATDEVLDAFGGDASSTNAFGFVLESVDLDLDGVRDLLVSDYFASSSGCVWAYSGATGLKLWKTIGGELDSRFGWSLGIVGDLDGDLVPEIVVGAPSDTSAPGRGRVTVLSGATGAVWTTHPADVEEWWLGLSVTGLRDVNGDGVPDYAAGAIDSMGATDAGRVKVFSGAGGVLYEVDGDSEDELLGWSLHDAGDLNADGRSDLLVGAKGDDLGGTGSGTVFVLSGLDGSVLRTHAGSEVDQWFGTIVRSLGDLDGDGVADYAAAAPSHDAAGQDAGSVTIFSGLDGSLLQFVAGPGPDLHWGTSLSEVGDCDGDGLDDWAAGAPLSHPAYDVDGFVRVFAASCSLGALSYCDAAQNSYGGGAILGTLGSTSLSANDLVLTVTGSVPKQFGYFFYGPIPVSTPAGDGRLCVHPGNLSLFRLLPPVKSNSKGKVSFAVDYGAPPMSGGPGGVDPGETWCFQYAYADPRGPGGTGFNFSDALRLRFCD